MKTSQVVVREIASVLHRRFLKDVGFKKSGLNWSRGVEWPQRFRFCLNKWNTADESDFRIDAGVFVEPLHSILRRPQIGKSPRDYDCEVRMSFCFEPTVGEKDWWRIHSTTDPAEFAEVLVRRIEKDTLPWLDGFKSYEAVANYLLKNEQWLPAAAAFHLAGDASRKAETMKIARSKINRFAFPYARELAARLGVEFPD